MGQITIDALRASGAGARSYLWDVEIIGMYGFDNLNVRCVSTEQPKPSLGVIIRPIRGFDFKEVGAAEWGDISFTTIETADYQFTDAIWKWFRRSYHPADGYQFKDTASPQLTDKQVMIKLNKLDRSMRKTWTLKGCILSGAPTFGELNNDKGTNQNVSFTVAYHYATLE